MDSVKAIFSNLGEKQVLLVNLGDGEVVTDKKRGRVVTAFGEEFLIVPTSAGEFPVPVKEIQSVEVLEVAEFVIKCICEM